jgi:LmeA-like phospholipid-binding
VSDYPGRPRSRAGWPSQPQQYTGDDYDAADYPPRRRRRRGRGIVISFLVLALVVAAFMIGDQMAKSYAQDKIARQIQTQAALAAKPSVNIEGFPFLTQLFAHDVRKVDISARNVREGKLVISAINATASGVHLNSSFSGATVDQVNGTAVITFASLEAAAGTKGITLAADPAGGPRSLQASAGPLAAKAKVKLASPTQVTVKMESLGGIGGSLIGQLPGYVINIPALPAGLKVNSVSVTRQGVVLTAAARNTTLSQ